MNWLDRLRWRLTCRPMPVVRIIERWVYMIVVVERRPHRFLLDGWSDCQGECPPKPLKRKRHRKRFRRRHSRYNHPY
jgi:hypothetical protein